MALAKHHEEIQEKRDNALAERSRGWGIIESRFGTHLDDVNTEAGEVEWQERERHKRHRESVQNYLAVRNSLLTEAETSSAAGTLRLEELLRKSREIYLPGFLWDFGRSVQLPCTCVADLQDAAEQLAEAEKELKNRHLDEMRNSIGRRISALTGLDLSEAQNRALVRLREHKWRHLLRVVGPAGTGKTLLLVQAAVAEAFRPGNESICVLGRTEALTEQLKRYAEALAAPYALPDNLAFLSIPAIVSAIAKYPEEAHDSHLVWRSFLETSDGRTARNAVPSPLWGYLSGRLQRNRHMQDSFDPASMLHEYVLEEIQFISGMAQDDESRQRAYLEIDRVGRGIGLEVEDRQALWGMWESFRRWCAANRKRPYEIYLTHAMNSLDAVAPGAKIRAQSLCFVDEFYDLFPAELALLLRSADWPNCRLVCVGDENQRTRVGKLRPKQVNDGLDFTNSSMRLADVHRASPEIARFLARISGASAFSDNALPLMADSSASDGAKPRLVVFGVAGRDEAFAFALRHALRERASNSTIGILVLHQALAADVMHLPDGSQFELRSDFRRWAAILDAEGVKWSRFDSPGHVNSREANGVLLGPAEGAIGLEFDAVVVSGFENDVYPVSENRDTRELLQQQMQTIYTALSRARQSLDVIMDSASIHNGSLLAATLQDAVADNLLRRDHDFI